MSITTQALYHESTSHTNSNNTTTITRYYNNYYYCYNDNDYKYCDKANSLS